MAKAKQLKQGSMSAPRHGRAQRLYCVHARQRLEDSREADDRGWQAVQTGDGLENKRFQSGEGWGGAGTRPSSVFSDNGALSFAAVSLKADCRENIGLESWIYVLKISFEPDLSCKGHRNTKRSRCVTRSDSVELFDFQGMKDLCP